jgi:hypothetical protein
MSIFETLEDSGVLAKLDLTAPSAPDILLICTELAEFLIAKNAAYGDSALKPMRVMSKADPAEQIRVRMDDKLSRLVKGQAAGEDPIKDLVGYWVLLQVLERRETALQEQPLGPYVPYLHDELCSRCKKYAHQHPNAVHDVFQR